MQPAPVDPEALQVQWLEDSLLVHAVTVSGASARVDANLLLVGACLGAAGVAVALLAGSVAAAVLTGAVWLACAVGLGRRGWQASRAVPPVPRRLLVELRPGKVAWTLLAGDRWSMRHDHDLAAGDILDAAAAETDGGAVVRIRLRDGSSTEIALHGLPSGDAAWLAARIDDVRVTEAE